MSRYWKQGFGVLALAAAVGLCCCSPAAAKKPDGVGGGKGGGGGGGATASPNPAFVYRDDVNGSLYLTNSDGSTSIRLTQSGNSNDEGAAWSPDLDGSTPGHQGWIAFFRQYDPRYIWGDLFIVPSDGSGPPVLVRSYTDFDTPPPDGLDKSFSWSPDGSRIIYVAGGLAWSVTLATGDVQWLPLTGSNITNIDTPTFSCDLELQTPGYQGKIAYRRGNDISVCEAQIDLAGNLSVGAGTSLTATPDFDEHFPVWSADGQYLAFYQNDINAGYGAGHSIQAIELATGFKWEVVQTYSSYVRPTWSPDGLYVAFDDAHQVGRKWTKDIFYVSPWLPGAPVNVTKTDSSRDVEIDPQWNPAWVDDIE